MSDMVGLAYNKMPEITAAFPEQLHKVIVQTVEIIAQLASDKAPKRTGFLASSIYYTSSDGSTYGQAIQAPGDSYLLPELPQVSDPFTAYAAVAANYGIFLEMGTRFMPAQPYFYQAVDEGRARLQDAINVFESFL